MAQNGCLAYDLGMPGTLIVLRHGQSTWNQLNLFTGWHDVPLTPQGISEAKAAGVTLSQAGMKFGAVHTSLLERAIDTTQLVLHEMGQDNLAVVKTWLLNERHYGALQGKDKAQTLAEYGEAQFLLWRRSFDTPPPPIDPGSEYAQTNDLRYADLGKDLPATECLADVVERMLPYWESNIVPDLKAGKTVMVVAHGNSLRALVKHLDGIGDSEIAELNIPTGIPLVYELDSNFKPVTPGGNYLDPQAAATAAAAVANQGKKS